MTKMILSSKKSSMIIIFSIMSISFCIFKGISLFYGFLMPIIFSVVILNLSSVDLKKIFKTILSGVWHCRSVYAVIILMGSTISIWMASGVVPMLMYYGFGYIEKMNFLFAAFIATSVISYVMGTAIGTISTIGIALYGVGLGFGIPKEIILGTLVSGAFIADKISPVSGLLNLTLKTLDINYKKFMKEQLKTFSIAIIITLVFYYILGMKYPSTGSGEDILMIKSGIWENFKITPWLTLFPLGVIILAVLGLNTVYTMSICLVVGILVSFFYQNNSIFDILNWVWVGFSANTGILKLDSIMKGGGIYSMLEVIMIVMSAVALSSLFELGGVFSPIIEKFIKNANSNGKLVERTAILSMLLTSLTCDQTVGILIPAKELNEEFDEKGLGRSRLATVISDSGTIIAPLEFWNVNGLILMTLLGISALEYAPYAFLCYIMPIVTIVYGLLIDNKKHGVKNLVQLQNGNSI